MEMETNSKRNDASVKGIFEEEKIKTKPNQLLDENPLNNELVLGVIIDRLWKRDWNSVRLVNKTWHSTLQRRWRDGKIYKLGNDDAGVNTITPMFLEHNHPLNNPNDSMQLERHPIRFVCMRKKDDSFNSLQPDQTRFWELYGHQLKSICFDRIRICDVALLKRLLFELTPSLEEFRYTKCDCDDIGQLVLNTATTYIPPATLQKNLRNFKIDSAYDFTSKDVDEYDYKLRFPISWIEFFAVFPSIHKLTLQIDTPVDRPSDLLKLFEAIDIIRKANNNEVLNIKYLFMGEPGAGFSSEVDVARNQSVFASLPIEILNIDISFMSTENRICFLQSFKSTLRHLTLQKYFDSVEESLPNNTFPQSLTHLYLVEQFFPSLEFLAYTPNLEELSLELQEITDMLQPEVCINLVAIPPLVNVKRLVYKKVKQAPFVDMGILATLMPNVKICRCEVDAEGFRALCRGWPNLEELDVSLRFGREAFFVKNLVQLKCLRSLTARLCIFKVTDKSVFKGFLKLPCLTRLHLQSDVEVTKEGLAALKTRFGRRLTLLKLSLTFKIKIQNLN